MNKMCMQRLHVYGVFFNDGYLQVNMVDQVFLENKYGILGV